MKNSIVQTPPLISESIRFYFKDMRKGEMYLEEAEFGLRRIIPFLDELSSGDRILEVGSGPCILLAEIVQRYPALKIHGIEPMSDGFAFFSNFVDGIRAEHKNLNIHLGGYETFSELGDWKLIFLVNVFEHLPDWQDFLEFVYRSLSDDGVCVVLCPNYGFPYESHFKLPVVFNKRLTKKIFQKRIERFEQENDNAGLYASLNFVTLKQVRKSACQHGLDLTVDTSVIRDMIERLDRDPAFQERQKFLAGPARFLKRTGLIEPILQARLVQNVLPYMQLTFRKAL